jgi:hypothetical protein
MLGALPAVIQRIKSLEDRVTKLEGITKP